eukprot:6463054-Amphidinium_carterae.1
MTLAAEGVQLLGEKGLLDSASRQQLASSDPSSCEFSSQCAAPSVPSLHDSASTLVTDLANHHLQIVQWRGDDIDCSTQTAASDSAMRACAHAAMHPPATGSAADASSETFAKVTSGIRLAWKIPTCRQHHNLRLCSTSPADLEAASQHLWQQIAEGADGLDRLKPRNGAGM